MDILELLVGKKMKVMTDLKVEVELEIKEDLNEEELADVIEVIYALAEIIRKTPQDLENTRKLKKDKNGGFSRKTILENP